MSGMTKIKMSSEEAGSLEFVERRRAALERSVQLQCLCPMSTCLYSIVRECVFYVFLKIQKCDFLRFLESAYQKNVKKRNPKFDLVAWCTLIRI